MRRLTLVRTFPNLSDLVDALSNVVVERITAAVAQRGRASLVVPGGLTPKHLFDGLSGRQAPWSQVDVALTDERWASDDPDASHEQLLRDRLLRGRAAKARFTSFRQAGDLAAARERAEAAMRGIVRPFDVTVLGMGADGHVASLFTNGVTVHPGALLEAVRHPGAATAEKRLTLTAEAISNSRLIALLITGPEKLAAFSRVLAAAEPLAICSVMQAAQHRFQVFYAP